MRATYSSTRWRCPQRIDAVLPPWHLRIGEYLYAVIITSCRHAVIITSPRHRVIAAASAEPAAHS
ncbi:MAG: hypothetical protein ACE37B_19525 [Ilumatobacter sp.]|uniref:hypothetical protein n=1 Tax=Ilumatobacter sp. TaxID=1967498 RepID=UPI003919265C